MSRRSRKRANTRAEIKQAARSLLNDHGPDGVSLRAIARQLGMSAPGLYRYFDNHDALIKSLCSDLYDELGQYMETARSRARDNQLLLQLFASARAFRAWAVHNHTEFALMFASFATKKFGSPGWIPPEADPESEPYASITRFSRSFGSIFDAFLKLDDIERGFTLVTPKIPPLSPELHREIIRCSQLIGVDTTIEYAFQFHSYWIRMYGLVAMEVFGQLPASVEAEALFEAELISMAMAFGVPADQLQ